MSIKRILVPTDFSDPSLKALDYAIDFIGARNAELLLLHVVEPIRNTRLMPDVSELLEHHRAEAVERFADLERRIRRHHHKCRSEVHFGVPYQVIAEIAQSSKSDLIVMASHGHSGLFNMFLGSVTERVVRIAQCPVLTIRASPAPTPSGATAKSAAKTPRRSR
jgi:nucleotide-binding universal stress UspA family protein